MNMRKLLDAADAAMKTEYLASPQTGNDWQHNGASQWERTFVGGHNVFVAVVDPAGIYLSVFRFDARILLLVKKDGAQ